MAFNKSTDGDKLRFLATWFEEEDNKQRWGSKAGTEVQDDLRRMAEKLDQSLLPITERELSALSFALQSEIQKYKRIAQTSSPTPSSNPTYLETLTKVVNRVDQLLGKG